MKSYGPRVYSQQIDKIFNTLLPFTCFYFILQFTTIYTPHSLANNKFKGIDNSLAHVGCKLFVLLCAAAEDGCG